MTETRQLTARQIRTDGGTQPRAELNQEKVQEYAENITRGHRFPAVDVFYDGKAHWLADGFHRHAAHIIARGSDELILAQIHQGTQRDAVLFSVGANASHGLPRSNDDKERAVTRLLRDEEWGKWSDREIGRACKVAHSYVGKIRADLTGLESSDERTYTNRHGATTTMKTAAIAQSNQDRANGLYHDPAPRWAAVSELEHRIRQRLPYLTGGRDLAEHLAELGRIKQGGRGGDEFTDLYDYLYSLADARKGDAWQAVNNVHDQMTQQLRQREQTAVLEATAPAAQFMYQRDAADRAEIAQAAAPLAAKIGGAAEADPRVEQIRHIRRQIEEMMIAAKDVDKGGADAQLCFALNRACIALDGAAAVLKQGEATPV